LDIKLKSSKSKYIISAIILLILISSSLGMYSTYPKIKEVVAKYEYNIFERNEFLDDIIKANYGIYFHMLKNKENEKLEPSDVILNLGKKYDFHIMQDMENYKTMFNEEVNAYKENLDEYEKNLEYYAIKKDTNVIEERNKDRLTLLLNNNLSSKTTESLNKLYNFYVVIDYDDSGNSTIKKLYGADMVTVTGKLKNNKTTDINYLELNPIKNMTYVYAVPKELKYNDSITYYKENNEIYAYGEVALFFIGMALLFIFIVGFITPYNISKQLIGFKRITKAPIEISVFVICVALGIMCSESSYILIKGTIEKNLINFTKIEVSSWVVSILVGAINIIYWLIGFGIIFIGIVILKHIFRIGITQYIKETSSLNIVL